MLSPFAEFYDKYVTRVYGYFFLRVQDRQRAEDLTHDTFRKACKGWAKRRQLRLPPDSDGAWLFKIARNALIDSYRQGGASRSEDVELDEEKVQLDEIIDNRYKSYPGDENSFIQLDIKRVMAALSERDRDMLYLSVIGLKNREIARACGMSEEGAQKAVRNAAKRLMERIS